MVTQSSPWWPTLLGSPLFQNLGGRSTPLWVENSPFGNSFSSRGFLLTRGESGREHTGPTASPGEGNGPQKKLPPPFNATMQYQWFFFPISPLFNGGKQLRFNRGAFPKIPRIRRSVRNNPFDSGCGDSVGNQPSSQGNCTGAAAPCTSPAGFSTQKPQRNWEKKAKIRPAAAAPLPFPSTQDFQVPREYETSFCAF